MKDCDAPAGREPSTFSALDPETLLPVAPAAARGGAVRRTARERRRERDRGRDDGRLPAAPRSRRRPPRRRRRAGGRSYGPAPGRGYGWDPVITDEHVFWMDNGRNHTDRTMLGERRRVEPGSPLVGATRRRRDPLGGDQRPALRDRVEPARLGSRTRDRRRLRRRQRRGSRRGGWRATSSPISGGATRSPTPAT